MVWRGPIVFHSRSFPPFPSYQPPSHLPFVRSGRWDPCPVSSPTATPLIVVIKTSPSRSLNPSKAVADMKSDNALMVMKIILFFISPFFAENGIVPKTYRKSNKARQSPQTTLGGTFNSDQSFEKSTSFYFMDIALSSQTSFGGNKKLSRLCTNYFLLMPLPLT